jgi:hypothetical protein
VTVEPAERPGTPDPTANTRVGEAFDAVRQDENLYDPGLMDRDTLTAPPASPLREGPDPDLYSPEPVQDVPNLPSAPEPEPEPEPTPTPRVDVDEIDPGLVSVADIGEEADFGYSDEAEFGDYISDPDAEYSGDFRRGFRHEPERRFRRGL